MNSFSLTKISGGPKVIWLPTKYGETITLLALLPLGSRYEKLSLNGASHFIEHLIFKGTNRRPSNFAIAQELDRLGAEYNGFTSKDHTGYWIKTIKKHFEKSIDLLSDVLFNSLFRQSDFDKEKGVIIQEIKMYRDNPLFYIESLFEQALYGPHPLGRLISGEVDQIKNLQLKDLLSFKNKFYQASNFILVLAGNVDLAKKKTVNKYFTTPSTNTDFPQFKAFKRRSPYSRIKILNQNTKQVQVALGGIGYAYEDKNLLPLQILSIILGGYMSSRLFSKIRVEQGLAYFVKMEANAYEDTGNFLIRAGVDKNKTEKTISLILEELNRIKKEPPSLEELNRAKDYYEGRLKIALEDSTDLASFYGLRALFYKRILTPQQLIKKLRQIKPSDIQRVAQELFTKKNLSLSLIGPFRNENSFKKILG